MSRLLGRANRTRRAASPARLDADTIISDAGQELEIYRRGRLEAYRFAHSDIVSLHPALTLDGVYRDEDWTWRYVHRRFDQRLEYTLDGLAHGFVLPAIEDEAVNADAFVVACVVAKDNAAEREHFASRLGLDSAAGKAQGN